jgi:autotransporter-associated beta strand protein
VTGWGNGTESLSWTAIPSLNSAGNPALSADPQLDFVGDSANAGAYFSNQNGYLFFRMRVAVGTVTSTTFRDAHLVLIDVSGWNYPTTDKTGYPDFGIAWDSKSNSSDSHGMEMQIPNTNGQGPTWGDIKMDDIDGSVGQKVAPPDINTTGNGYIRTIDGQATTNFGNTTFIDFAISRSYLNPIPFASPENPYLVNILTSDFRLQFGSIHDATDHNAINADVAGNYTLTSNVTTSWSTTLSANLDLVWTGAGNSTWDLTSNNWRQSTGGTNPVAPDIAFLTNDNVYFTNNATGGNITVQSGGVQAGEIFFSNSNGTVSLVGGNITAKDLTMTGAGSLTLNNTITLLGPDGGVTAGALTNSGSGNVTVAGVLTAGKVVQSGTGTLTLSANNTYTGATDVTGGTLLVNGNQTSATGAVSVASGATLGGTGTLGGATTIAGIVSPGALSSIGTLNIANNVTWKGASSNSTSTDWIFQLGASNTADLLNITGNFTKASTDTEKTFRFDFAGSTNTGTFKLIDWTGTSSFSAGDFSFTNLGSGLEGSFTVNGTELDFSVFPAVPEPATWVAMAALGLTGGTVALHRRRRKCSPGLQTNVRPHPEGASPMARNGGTDEMGSPIHYIPDKARCRVEERRMRFLPLQLSGMRSLERVRIFSSFNGGFTSNDRVFGLIARNPRQGYLGQNMKADSLIWRG